MSQLPAGDRKHLDSLGLSWSEEVEGGHVCVVIAGWPLPAGYEPGAVDLLLRLPGGYPDVPPDMFWCDPAVRLTATNAAPPASELVETYLGRAWQRFSRHLPAGAWKPGADTLQSYLAVIRTDLCKTAA